DHLKKHTCIHLLTHARERMYRHAHNVKARENHCKSARYPVGPLRIGGQTTTSFVQKVTSVFATHFGY
ncbi:unnamed protein product, partial [Sphenostylis stenocarpa]